MSSALPSTLQQLDANHEILKILIENSFDSILITDATLEGKIIYANDSFTKLTGYEIDEVIGKTPRILQGKATEKKVIDRLTGSLKEGGSFEGKTINYRKDGSPFIMYWRVLPIKKGQTVFAWIAIQNGL